MKTKKQKIAKVISSYDFWGVATAIIFIILYVIGIYGELLQVHADESAIIYLAYHPPIYECTTKTSPVSAKEIPEIKFNDDDLEDNTPILMELPNISTKSKLFTDYRVYNIDGTPHKRLQKASYTDCLGLRRFNNDYIVALGSYYSTNIGDRFRVTLSSGSEFTVILGDGKWDIDCDKKNMYTPVINYDLENVGNLLEFIIDSDILPKDVFEYGSLEKLDVFQGDVIRMEYLGRDDSQDWDTYF